VVLGLENELLVSLDVGAHFLFPMMFFFHVGGVFVGCGNHGFISRNFGVDIPYTLHILLGTMYAFKCSPNVTLRHYIAVWPKHILIRKRIW
jgi:hypothetical protein